MPTPRRARLARRSSAFAACGACALLAVPALAGSASAGTPAALPVLHISPVASASTSATPPQSLPDDIAALGGNLFVTYQNGVSATGGAAGSGVTQSSIVEYSPQGAVLQTWLLTGRCDGLGADPQLGVVIATVNEDNNSYLATLAPGQASPATYTYSPDPAQQATGETSSNGGTDSVTVGPDGTIYIAHSNPDPGYPSTAATYTATLSGSTATLTPLFPVDGSATEVSTGQPTTLALTDPDSNRYLPASAPVLPGALLQDSQGDGKVVIVDHPHTGSQSLRQLSLSNAENATQPTIDDLEEVTGPGTLYVVDQGAGTVQAIDTTDFTPGTIVVSQPADSGNTGQLGVLDPTTGVITHFASTFTSPKGLVFVPASVPTPALPESPFAAALPIGALGIAGAAVVLRRRRATA